MKTLENRIPPPLLMLVTAGMMWGSAKFLTPISLEPGFRIALLLVLNMAALFFGLGGIITFRLAKTTINPVQIDQASSVVTNGVYRLSRNPMYVGLTALLATWAVLLSVPWTLLGPVFFAVFIHRFQILPEERVMSPKFGPAYDDYRRRVRRWI